MYQIQILLPLFDNAGEALPKSLYAQVRDEMLDRFGGLTAYTRAPAAGLWQDDQARTVRDEVVIYEVTSTQLDAEWWKNYRLGLQVLFKQDTIIIRSCEVQLL